MHHYADRCCINLDNWSIFQQHNWHNYGWYFCFHDDNESEAVEAHIPRHRDSKTKKPRHWDSKTKKPRHRVPVEFWHAPWYHWGVIRTYGRELLPIFHQLDSFVRRVTWLCVIFWRHYEMRENNHAHSTATSVHSNKLTVPNKYFWEKKHLRGKS